MEDGLLDEVVVGAAAYRLGGNLLVALPGKDNHRQGDTLFLQRSEHVEAVDRPQPVVRQQEIVILGAGLL